MGVVVVGASLKGEEDVRRVHAAGVSGEDHASRGIAERAIARWEGIELHSQKCIGL
jgi:hypothetical protein